jgi:hypothetical protein
MLPPRFGCHRPGPALVPARAWRGYAALALAAIPTLAGCYTHAPLASTPAPGAVLVLDLNDRGRVTLGDSIGPSAREIQGVVRSSTDSAYVLSVSSIQYLNGQTNRWSGEPLIVRMDLVGRARERRYSRARTYGLVGGIVAAIAAVALTTDLFGSGVFGKDPGPPGPGPVQ